MSREKKERPYLRSIKRISKPDEKPRFRIVKIDENDRRRQITIEQINDRSVEWYAEQFTKNTAGGG